MRWGEGKDESLDANTKALWQGNALALTALCGSSISGDRLYVTATMNACTFAFFCAREAKQRRKRHQRGQIGGRTKRTRYHDNPSQSRLLSWRYESLPRTCENRHQTRTNKPHRKFFPPPQNRRRKKKGKWSEWGEKLQRFKGEKSQQHAAQSVPRMQLPPTHRASLQHAVLAGPGWKELRGWRRTASTTAEDVNNGGSR